MRGGRLTLAFGAVTGGDESLDESLDESNAMSFFFCWAC